MHNDLPLLRTLMLLLVLTPPANPYCLPFTNPCPHLLITSATRNLLSMVVTFTNPGTTLLPLVTPTACPLTPTRSCFNPTADPLLPTHVPFC